MRDFEHITEWIFDLDNTLYPRSCDLFTQIDRRMTQYVMALTELPWDAARKLQKDLYRDHGTTLNGLMHLYNIDPDDYLRAVHSIDYSPVVAHPEFISLVRALPGRKFIFTNADSGHAETVLERLGGADIFDGMFDIRDAGYQPKPARASYEKFLATFDVAPHHAAIFDDLDKNLAVPHELGMRTVQVIVAPETIADDEADNWHSLPKEARPHVHYETDDLPAFLRALHAAGFAAASPVKAKKV